MACFLVSAAEAVVVTVASKVAEKKEKEKAQTAAEPQQEGAEIEAAVKIPFSTKLKWLSYMLWGGAILLAFEHVWHGEVVPWFPFLTAASDPKDALEMLHEMATVGVAMALLVTVVWLGMLGVVSAMEKRMGKMLSKG